MSILFVTPFWHIKESCILPVMRFCLFVIRVIFDKQDYKVDL